MTTELANLSSASGASVQLSDKSGQVAAQLLSGTAEEARNGGQQEKMRVLTQYRKVRQNLPSRYKTCKTLFNNRGGL